MYFQATATAPAAACKQQFTDTSFSIGQAMRPSRVKRPHSSGEPLTSERFPYCGSAYAARLRRQP
jgi:hypothetical protein